MSELNCMLAKARGVKEYWAAPAQYGYVIENVIPAAPSRRSPEVQEFIDFMARVFGEPNAHHAHKFGDHSVNTQELRASQHELRRSTAAAVEAEMEHAINMATLKQGTRVTSKLINPKDSKQPHHWAILEDWKDKQGFAALMDSDPEWYAWGLDDFRAADAEPYDFQLVHYNPVFKRQYHLAHRKREWANDWVKKLEKAGIVGEIESPYAPQVIVAPKKDEHGAWTDLGYAVDYRVEPMADKVEANNSLPAPMNVSDVRHFLGMATYYCRFLESFSPVKAPLTALTEKDAPWKWGAAEQQSFDAIRAMLVSAPVMRHPDWRRPFVLHTDWSQARVGACLSQADDNGVEYAVSLASRMNTPVEAGMSSYEGEVGAVAVAWAVQRFRYYMRSLILAEYDFSINHRPGKDNTVPDLLSRRPMPAGPARATSDAAGTTTAIATQKSQELRWPTRDVWSSPVAISYLRGETTPADVSVEVWQQLVRRCAKYSGHNDKVRALLKKPVDMDNDIAVVNLITQRADMLRAAMPKAFERALQAQHRDVARYRKVRRGDVQPRRHRFETGSYVYVAQPPLNTLDVRTARTILRVVEILESGWLRLSRSDGNEIHVHMDNWECAPCHLSCLVPARYGRGMPACKGCGSDSIAAPRLICDKCQAMWHVACAKAELHPCEEWLCPDCAPPLRR
eukprot:jgi/Tetstr1/457649/TSEL_004230.t1